MKRLIALFSALFLAGSLTFAQSNDDIESEQPIVSQDITFNMNEPGDQFIKIGLMVTFPLNFGGSFPLFRSGQLSTGGAGQLGYHRFINKWMAWGIDIAFGYNPTIGSNVFTYVPLMFNFMFQPTYKKFEFPVTVGVGSAMETYLNNTYFPGLVLKGQAGVFYRVNPSWSFGLEGDFTYMPQWYKDSSKNDYGIFGSALISARYHF